MKLSVENLSVERGGLPVLEGVSFTLEPGQALVLRGPNGIGKTTLLRTIVGLQPAVTGTITPDEDALAYAGHADGIKAQLSVAENLRFWAQVFGAQEFDGQALGGAGIAQALHQFNLEPLANRPAGSLSAGQKRRLGLARLLVTGRPVWVLDEPTVSLDTASVQLFAEAIQIHLTQGGSAIMATHIDLGLAKARVLDLTPFKAQLPAVDDFDGAFL